MAELTPKELLQPSLLERLTDNRRDRELDTIEERVMSFRRYRESVVRDLEWLLNTSSLEPSEDLNDFPEARRSVINYGMPDLAGVWAVGKDGEALERKLRQVILDFEPRILPDSLKIRVAIKDEEMSANTMTFEIEGELWWQPLPERFFIKTTLDLDLGKFVV
jgi:type VI secretion system protein ImpF